MVGKKRSKKFNLSNKLAYTLIAIFSIIFIGVGVYAAVAAGTTPNPGHSIQTIGAPTNCAVGQYLRYTNDQGCGSQLGGSSPCWQCATPATTPPYVNPYNAYYTDTTNVIMFQLRWTGSAFVSDKTLVLSTTDVTNKNYDVVVASTTVSGSYYKIRASFNGYYMDSKEVVSAQYIAQNGLLKLSMSNTDGNNLLEFVISDDASANTLTIGDEINFIVAFPTLAS
jgi:hypothetical protein